MMKIFESGNLKEKGYKAKMLLLFPIFTNNEIDNIIGKNTKTKEISFASKICLTSNKYYVRIEVVILGFGLMFEIQERS